MENINSLYLIQPIVVILITTGLMLFFYRKYHFHKTVFLYTLIAYGGAIVLKYAIQIPTINSVINLFGPQSVGLGVYYGVQTVVLEVGLAYLVAYYAVKYAKLDRKDSQAYGGGLAFWENGVLLGLFPLINLITYLSVLSSNTPLAQTLFNQLMAASPSLFASNPEALSLVALGSLERFSSILLHLAWGYLCFMAAYTGKKKLFLIALPMGFVDFLVPFAQINMLLFEAVFFGLAVLSVLIAWLATKGLHKNGPVDKIVNQQTPEP
jgi:hypothetical protein